MSFLLSTIDDNKKITRYHRILLAYKYCKVKLVFNGHHWDIGKMTTYEGNVITHLRSEDPNCQFWSILINVLLLSKGNRMKKNVAMLQMSFFFLTSYT